MRHTKDAENEEQKLFHCSDLIRDIKEKVQMLKNYGMSEKEIMSSLQTCQPLKKLIVSRNYRIFLGDERVEVLLPIRCSTPSMRSVQESGRSLLQCSIEVSLRSIILKVNEGVLRKSLYLANWWFGNECHFHKPCGTKLLGCREGNS